MDKIKVQFLHRENSKYSSPQRRPLQTSSYEGIASQICLPLTVSCCVFGATLGFCLLVAGGVGLSQLGNIKVLMYVGILMFLVSVILLVILCSSFDIFHIVPVIDSTPQRTKRMDDIFYQKDQFKFADDHIVPYIIPNSCPHLPPCLPASIQDDVIIPSRKVETLCTVKNCVCLLKNCDNRSKQVAITADTDALYEIPSTVDVTNKIEFCSHCHQLRPHVPECTVTKEEMLQPSYQRFAIKQSSDMRFQDLTRTYEEIPMRKLNNG